MLWLLWTKGWLIAARSGHGHFAAYHERFGHEETDSNCVCGQKRAQLHRLGCAHAMKHRLHLWCDKRQRQLAPDEVLGTPEGVTAFAKWEPATGLFHRRYGVGEENGVGEWKKGHNWTTTDWTQERLMCIIYCTIDRKASGLQDIRPVDRATCCTWGSRHMPTTGLSRRKINLSLSLSFTKISYYLSTIHYTINRKTRNCAIATIDIICISTRAKV